MSKVVFWRWKVRTVPLPFLVLIKKCIPHVMYSCMLSFRVK